MDYFWQPPRLRYDPAQAKKLLAEAGYPNGFDAGDLSGDTIYGVGDRRAGRSTICSAVGIRVRLRPMERAAFFKEYGEKKLRGVLYTRQRRPSATPPPGSRPTRWAAAATSTAAYPDIDGLFAEQVNEIEPARAPADPPPDPADHRTSG